MSKRIILTLAEDATNRICGTCRFLDGDRGGYCDAFSEYVKDETKRTRHNEIVNGLRLPACIAAEQQAARLVDIAPESARDAVNAGGFTDPECVMDEWKPVLSALAEHAKKARG